MELELKPECSSQVDESNYHSPERGNYFMIVILYLAYSTFSTGCGHRSRHAWYMVCLALLIVSERKKKNYCSEHHLVCTAQQHIIIMKSTHTHILTLGHARYRVIS